MSIEIESHYVETTPQLCQYQGYITTIPFDRINETFNYKGSDEMIEYYFMTTWYKHWIEEINRIEPLNIFSLETIKLYKFHLFISNSWFV